MTHCSQITAVSSARPMAFCPHPGWQHLISFERAVETLIDNRRTCIRRDTARLAR